eukprot:s1522_g1.t1
MSRFASSKRKLWWSRSCRVRVLQQVKRLSVAWELRKILRLVLPPAVPEDVLVFCRDLQGEVAKATGLGLLTLELLSLDRTVTGTLSADFALRGPASGFETATAARLAACIARASTHAQGSGTSLPAQSLLHRAEVQLVMRRVRKGAASQSNPARGAGVERLLGAWEPEEVLLPPRMTEVPEHVSAPWEKLPPAPSIPCMADAEDKRAPLDEKVAALFTAADGLAADRQKLRLERQGKIEARIRQQQAQLQFRAAGRRLLRYFRPRFDRKVASVRRIQKQWRKYRLRSSFARCFEKRRKARRQLQSWFRGTVGRQAYYRRMVALSMFRRVVSLAPPLVKFAVG